MPKIAEHKHLKVGLRDLFTQHGFALIEQPEKCRGMMWDVLGPQFPPLQIRILAYLLQSDLLKKLLSTPEIISPAQYQALLLELSQLYAAHPAGDDFWRQANVNPEWILDTWLGALGRSKETHKPEQTENKSLEKKSVNKKPLLLVPALVLAGFFAYTIFSKSAPTKTNPSPSAAKSSSSATAKPSPPDALKSAEQKQNNEQQNELQAKYINEIQSAIEAYGRDYQTEKYKLHVTKLENLLQEIESLPAKEKYSNAEKHIAAIKERLTVIYIDKGIEAHNKNNKALSEKYFYTVSKFASNIPPDSKEHFGVLAYYTAYEAFYTKKDYTSAKNIIEKFALEFTQQPNNRTFVERLHKQIQSTHSSL